MKEVKLTVYGEPRSKKNSMQIVINPRTHRPFIVQGKAYKAYERETLHQLQDQYDDLPIEEPVNVQCVFYRSKKIRVDLANLEEAILDVMVLAGTLKDDFFGIVASMDGSRIDFDKENPRTEITITEEEEWLNRNAKNAHTTINQTVDALTPLP